MRRFTRLVLTAVLCAGASCYDGAEENWEPERNREFPAGPLDLEEIEDVGDLPALEGEDALRQLARETPPVDQYQFIGYARLEGEPLWIHDQAPEGTVGEVLSAAGIELGDALQGTSIYWLPTRSPWRVSVASRQFTSVGSEYHRDTTFQGATRSCGAEFPVRRCDCRPPSR